jgi:small basic protein
VCRADSGLFDAQLSRSRLVAILQLFVPRQEERSVTNFIVYFVGTLLVVAGLAYAASRLGVSSVWIVAGALVILGLGLMGGIVKTRQKDPA